MNLILIAKIGGVAVLGTGVGFTSWYVNSKTKEIVNPDVHEETELGDNVPKVEEGSPDQKPLKGDDADASTSEGNSLTTDQEEKPKQDESEPEKSPETEIKHWSSLLVTDNPDLSISDPNIYFYAISEQIEDDAKSLTDYDSNNIQCKFTTTTGEDLTTTTDPFVCEVKKLKDNDKKQHQVGETIESEDVTQSHFTQANNVFEVKFDQKYITDIKGFDQKLEIISKTETNNTYKKYMDLKPLFSTYQKKVIGGTSSYIGQLLLKRIDIDDLTNTTCVLKQKLGETEARCKILDFANPSTTVGANDDHKQITFKHTNILTTQIKSNTYYLFELEKSKVQNIGPFDFESQMDVKTQTKNNIFQTIKPVIYDQNYDHIFVFNSQAKT